MSVEELLVGYPYGACNMFGLHVVVVVVVVAAVAVVLLVVVVAVVVRLIDLCM